MIGIIMRGKCYIKLALIFFFLTPKDEQCSGTFCVPLISGRNVGPRPPPMLIKLLACLAAEFVVLYGFWVLVLHLK